jgi:tetratricopeptide (TPR) repeat protein/transglutaminase-like putative cysteine protease
VALKKAGLVRGHFALVASSAALVSTLAPAAPLRVLDPVAVASSAEAKSARGAAAYVALRRIWRRWDQVEPTQLEEAFRGVETDARVSAPVRAYAGLLGAYARRRRGDLEGAQRRVRELGYVSQWLTLGPFDNEGGEGLEANFGPERDLDAPLAGKSYAGKERATSWRLAPPIFPYGWVDLGSFLRPSEKICAYATTFVRAAPPAAAGRPAEAAARARQATVWAGAAGAFRVYWNGREIIADPAYRALDADRLGAQVTVQPGWNRLTLKVCGDEDGALYQVRLGDAAGAPDASLQVSADPALADEIAARAGKAAPTAAPATAATARVEPGVSPATAGPTPGGVASATAARAGAPAALPAKGNAPAAPPPTLGPLAEVLRARRDKSVPPAQLETLSRYLALTGGEDRKEHLARDFAQRAAEAAPTTERMLLASELAEDRNASGEWLRRARARLRPGEDEVELLVAEGLHARSGVNWREAVPYFERALALDPRNVAALLGRVELYAEAGLRQTTIATLERALVEQPHSVALLRLLAHQYQAVGRSAEGDEAEDRYLRLRFDDPTALRHKLDVALARRDRAAVDHWSERLLALDGSSLNTVEFVARSLRALGEGPRALALLERRLEAAPDDVDAMRLLADFHGEAGRRDEQIKLLRQVLALRPQAKDVREYVEHARPTAPRRDEAFAWDRDKVRALGKAPTPPGFAKRTLRDLQVTTVHPNGLASRFHQVVFQPLTDEGAESARQYGFTFQAGRDVVDLRAARVYRANGTVDETIETGEAPVNNPAIAMYTSTRSFVVQLPRLAPGDVVELRYRVDETTPRNDFGDTFSETSYFQSFEPVASAEYVLLTPRARRVPLRVPEGLRVKREERDEGELHVARVSAENVAPLLPEPLMPPLPEVAAPLGASTFASWEDVGRWFWGLARDQLDSDAETRKLARDLTKGLTDEREKVRAVYDFVVQKTRYVALEFGIEGFKPRRCTLTLSRGWGDCKDKAAVIVALLRELGIPARMVLVRTGMRGLAPTDAPSYAFFDHAIAYVPSLDLYLDGTAEYTGMTELPAMDRGAIGLQIVDGQGKLVRLPEPPASETRRTRTIELTLGDGPAGLDLRVESTGAFASEWRQRYHPESTRRARALEDFGREFGGLSLQNGPAGLDVGRPDDIERPVQVRLKGRALGVTRSEGGDYGLPVSPLGSLVGNYAVLSSRRHPLKLPVNAVYDDEWVIKLPANLRLKHAPPSKAIDSPFGKLDLRVEPGAGKVVVRAKLSLEKTRIAPAEYAAFRAFCEEVDRAFAERVVIGR